MDNWCSGAIVSCSLACVVGALVAPGVRLARPDVHGYVAGRVWLVASLLACTACSKGCP